MTDMAVLYYSARMLFALYFKSRHDLFHLILFYTILHYSILSQTTTFS